MDGILLINKPKNMTSRDIVNIISKKFNTGKVGHTGTLDPIATGVLGIAIGNGVKIVDFLINDTKEYIAKVRMGIMTDTLDITGDIIEKTDNITIDAKTLDAALHTFLGKSIQEVPLYSALKVNGTRLYDYARKKIKVELPKREIEIFDIRLLELNKDSFKFKVVVSKGTYIRSLIRDIGNKINIPCVMEELTRTKQGNFKIEDSYSLEDIQNDNYKVLTLREALKNMNIVKVDDFIAKKILNGRILENRYDKDKIVFVNSQDEVLAIYKVYDKDNTKIKPIKVIYKKDL